MLSTIALLGVATHLPLSSLPTQACTSFVFSLRLTVLDRNLHGFRHVAQHLVEVPSLLRVSVLRLLSRVTCRLFRRRLFRLIQLKLLGPLFVFVLRLAFLVPLVIVIIFAALWFRHFTIRTLGFLALGVFACILVLALVLTFLGLGRAKPRVRASLRLRLSHEGTGQGCRRRLDWEHSCLRVSSARAVLRQLGVSRPWSSMSEGLVMRFCSSLQSCSFGPVRVRHAAKESKLGKLL